MDTEREKNRTDSLLSRCSPVYPASHTQRPLLASQVTALLPHWHRLHPKNLPHTLLFVCIHIANQNTHLKFENVNTLVKITICMFINVLLHVHFIYFILLCFKYLFLILCTTFFNIFFLLLISLFLTITVIASFTQKETETTILFVQGKRGGKKSVQ